ncbi:MAG: hypothetical protein GH155_01900 [Spirochaeta sp.]|nr:hypothetical protein [Spirochaeta sp.]
MEEKRENERKAITVTTIVRKMKPAGGQAIMEFCSRDLSRGGLFISTENLELFDLGEEIDILVDHNGEKYYEGTAEVVRSARVFGEEGEIVDCGYGLMFLNPGEDFKAMLLAQLAADKT